MIKKQVLSLMACVALLAITSSLSAIIFTGDASPEAGTAEAFDDVCVVRGALNTPVTARKSCKGEVETTERVDDVEIVRESIKILPNIWQQCHRVRASIERVK